MAKVRTTASQLLIVLVAITMVLTIINLGFTLSLAKKIGNTGAAPTPTPTPTPTPSADTRIKASVDDDAVMGSASAKVTIIEFSDYQCPYCGRFYSQTLPQIEDNYIKTGKVKLVFRDFPLSFHENAQKAAEAAECSGEQGKYYEMHNKLYANQGALAVDNLKQYAKDLGLDTAKFNDCLDTGKMAAETAKDFKDGQAYGISGTPSFLIGNDKNGYTKLVGAQPYDSFKTVLDAELAK